MSIQSTWEGSTLPVIDLSQTCLSSPPISKYLPQVVSEVLEYPTIELYDELAESLALVLDVPPEAIAFGNGAAGVIEALTASVPCENVIVLSPTFFLYERFAKKYGKRIQRVRWDDPNRLEILQRLLSKTQALLWIANPNNPTAHYLTSDSICKLAGTGSSTIIVDESFADFAGTSIAKEVYNEDGIIVVRSFSKSFGLSGARVGYCITHEKTTHRINAMMDPLSTSRIGVVLALHCLSEFLNEYESRWHDMRDGISRFVKSLEEMGLVVLHGPCNFVSLNFSSGEEASSFVETARRLNLNLRSGKHWEFSGNCSCLVRVSLPPLDFLSAAVERIRMVVKSYQGESAL